MGQWDDAGTLCIYKLCFHCQGKGVLESTYSAAQPAIGNFGQGQHPVTASPCPHRIRGFVFAPVSDAEVLGRLLDAMTEQIKTLPPGTGLLPRFMQMLHLCTEKYMTAAPPEEKKNADS